MSDRHYAFSAVRVKALIYIDYHTVYTIFSHKRTCLYNIVLIHYWFHVCSYGALSIIAEQAFIINPMDFPYI